MRRVAITYSRVWATALLAWMLGGLAGGAKVHAQPVGGQVLAGEAAIAGTGLSTTITAGNNAVLRWETFNVPAQGRVEFIQPGKEARVLNWIGGATPSQIDGSLLANGQVYLMNRAGIYFGSTAVVDVGALYAVGGSVSKEDFLAGVNRFTDLTGEVRNEGQLRGATIALVGRSILNTGSIVAPDGFVGLAAGDQIFLRQTGSRILVDAGPANVAGVVELNGTGVANRGDISVGRGQAVLAAGDLYAVAIAHDGRLSGRDVTLAGQARGDVVVRGIIDASSVTPGVKGGNVTITGERVGILNPTTIDASGLAGGGSIRVGGDFQGANAAVRNAQVTVVGREATLRADATQAGDGGRVIVWSDGATRYEGNLSARGRGENASGGFAEVSGKEHLVFTGSADLLSNGGSRGTLLLDPTNITIFSGTPDLNGDGTTGDDLALGTKDSLNVSTAFPGVTSLITSGQVQTLLASTDLTFAATNTITVSSAVTWNSAFALTLTADNSVVINAPVSNSGTGAITLSAGAGGIALGANLGSSGAVTVNHAGAVTQSGGRVSASTLQLQGAGTFGASAGARIVTEASSLQLAKTGGAVFVENRRNAGVSVTGTLTGGSFDLRSLNLAGDSAAAIAVSGSQLRADGVGLNGSTLSVGAPITSVVGSIDLNASTDVSLTAALNSAGAVTIGFGGAATGAFTASGDVTAAGAFTITGGSNADTLTLSGSFTTGPAVNGGGGSDAVTLSSGSNAITVTGTTAFTVGSATFTSIEAVAGGSNGLTLAGNDDDAITVTASGSANLRGIGFTGVTSIAAGAGTDTVTLTGGADSFQLNGSNGGSGLGITFSGIESVVGGAGSDILINGTGVAFTAGATSIGGVAFSGFEAISTAQLNLSGGADTFTVSGPGAGSSLGVNYVGLLGVDALGGSDGVVLTNGSDTFAVTALNTGSVAGIIFSNIENVDAATGSDTLINSIPATAFTVGAASLGGIGFTGFETITTPLLNLTAGADSFVVTGAATGTVGTITYNGLTAVDALGGTDSVTLTSGADAVVVADSGIVTAQSIAFSNFETVAGGGGLDSVTLRSSGDTIVVSANNNFSGAGIAFTGITNVAGGGGADAVTLTTGSDTITVTANGTFTSAGINFSAISSILGNGGTDTVTLPSGDDTLSVTNLGAFSARALQFSQITAVDAGGGDNTLTLTSAGDTFTVTANNAGFSNGLTFTNLSTVDGSGGTDSLVNTTTSKINGGGNGTRVAGMRFLSFESVATPAIQLTAGADAFTQTGPGTGVFEGASYSGLTEVDGLGGTDTVTLTTLPDAITLLGANSFLVGNITYLGIEAVVGNGGGDTLAMTSASESVTILTTGGFAVSGVAFSGVNTVTGGGGVDTVTLTTGADAVTVNGLNNITTAGVTFSGIAAVAGNTGTDTITLGAGNDLITVTGPNAATFLGINFTAIEEVLAGAGVNTVSLTTGSDAFTITGPGAGTGAGISFNGIAAVDGGLGTDTLGNGIAGTPFTVGDTSIAGVTFSGFEIVDTARLRLTALAETFQLTGAATGTLSPSTVIYTGLTEVDGLAGSNSLTLTIGADAVTVNAPNAITVGGTAFLQFQQIAGNGGADTVSLTGADDAVQVALAPNSFTAAGIGFTGFVGLDGGGGNDTVTLTAAADNITLTGTQAVSTSGIAFSNIEAVDAGVGAGADLLTLTAGDDAISVLGLNRLSTGGINFTNVEAVAAGAGNDSVTLTTGVDAVLVNGSKSATTYGITFTAIEALALGDGVDVATLTTGNDTVVVTGLKEATTHDIAFTGVDIIAGNGGFDTVTLTPGADVIVVTGLNAFTTAGIAFMQFSSVTGGDGTDEVLLTSANDAIAVTAVGAITTSGVSFGGIEVVDAAGGSDSVTLTAGDETISLLGLNQAFVSGITLNNIEAMAGGSGVNNLTLTTAADTAQITGSNSVAVAGITFSDIRGVDAAAGIDRVVLPASDDVVTVSNPNQISGYGIAFTNIEEIDGGGGTNRVTLSGADETITVAGTRSMVAAGVTFFQIDAVDAGAGTDTLTLTNADDSLSIGAPGTITAAGITFSNLDVVDGGGGLNILSLSSGDDSVTVTGSREFTTGSLLFKTFSAVDAKEGFDTVVLPTLIDTVTLTGQKSMTISDIAFSQIERLNATGGISNLILSPGDDEVVVTGLRQAVAGGIEFTSLLNVYGANGNDRVALPASPDIVEITGAQSVSAAGMSFFQIERLEGGGSNNTLRGTSGAESWSISGGNSGSVRGISFSNFSELNSGGSGVDTFAFTSGSADVTGKLSGNGAALRLESTASATVNVSAPIESAGLRFSSSGGGGFILKNSANQVGTVAGTLGGSLVMLNAAPLAVGSVDGATGLSVGGDLLLEAQTGGLSLQTPLAAGRNLSLKGSTINQASTVAAGGVDPSGSLDVRATLGAITMTSVASASTRGGTLRYEAAQGIDLGLLDAGTGVVSLVAGGALRDVNGTETNLAGAAARIQTSQGNVGTSDRGLEVDVSTIALRNNGSIYLAAKKNITVGPVSAVSVRRVELNGTLTTVTDEALSTGAIGGEFLLKAEGDIGVAGLSSLVTDGNLLLESLGGRIDVNAPVSTNGGSVSVRAASGIGLSTALATSSGRSLDLETQRGDVAMGPLTTVVAGGAARLAAGGNVTLGSVQANQISVIAGGSILTLGTGVALTAPEIRLQADQGVGASAAPLLLSVAKLEGVTRQGDVFVSNREGLTIGGVGPIPVDRVSFAGTSFYADPELTGLVAGGAITVSAGGSGSGNLAVVESVTAEGNLSLRAPSGGVAIDASLSAGNSVTVSASGRVTQNATITGGKTERAPVVHVESTAGDLSMSAGAVTRVSDGLIRYVAAGDVGLGQLAAGAGNVVVSAGGTISDVNGAGPNVVAGSVQFVATGGSAGSAADPLETTVSRIEARVRDSIHIRETDGLTIGGSVAAPLAGVPAAGPVLVPQADAGGLYSVGSAAGRAIVVSTNSGQIAVAPGAVVSTSSAPVTPVGTITLGSGTDVQAGASIAGGSDFAGVVLSGEVRSAGTLQLSGVRLEAGPAGRSQIEVGANTTVSLRGADVRSFGNDTIVSAALQDVVKIEAARDIVIRAPIRGVNLSLTADVDQAVSAGDGAAGGVLIIGAGSITNVGNLSVVGAALSAVAGDAAGQSIHIAATSTAPLFTTAGDLSLSAQSTAPAGAAIGIVSDGGPGIAVASSGGNITVTPARGGSIRLEGTSGATPLVAAGSTVTFNGSVLVDGLTRVASTSGGDILFSGPVDGLRAGAGELAVATSGTVRFSQAVGGISALSTLIASSGGVTELNGGLVSTTGVQQYGNAVVLGATTNLVAGELTFGGQVRGVADGAQSLELAVDGFTRFNATVGPGGGRLAQITSAGGGGLRFSGDRVATTGIQRYQGAVIVAGRTAFSGTGLTFGGAVDSADGSSGDIIATISGDVVFGGPVGQTARLGEVSTSAGTTMRLFDRLAAGSVTIAGQLSFERATSHTIDTTGAQTFGGRLNLTSNLTLVASAGNIELRQGAGGAGRTLVMLAPKGEISVGGDLGSATARLDSVQLEARDVIVKNVFTAGDIALAIGADPGTPTAARNAFLQITGTTIDSEKGAVVLGTGARTPDNTADDKSGAPLRSSLFKSNGGDLRLVGNTVTIQPFERLAVRDGNLVVIGDTALTLSNLSASKTIALVSPRIQLRSRSSQPLILTGDTVQEDRGTDLVGARVVFFRDNTGDSPTRSNLDTFDFGLSPGNLLNNLPEVISVLPPAGGNVQTVFVADLSDERAVLRPLVASVVYLDLRTAAGLNDSAFVPPARFGAEDETPVFSLVAAGLLRATVEQAYVPVLPQQERTGIASETPLAAAVREQLQALGIYARALLPAEVEARGRRAGLFVVVPEKARPRESDYEVVDARVEAASVREVLRLAAVTGLIGDNGAALANVAEALATVYEVFSAESAVDDPLKFRDWVERRSDAASRRVVDFVQALQTMFSRLERLGLTRQELNQSRAQIYGSILMPRLNADPDFLRGVIEAGTVSARAAASDTARLTPPSGQ